jgi:HK97 family phage prohead protease
MTPVLHRCSDVEIRSDGRTIVGIAVPFDDPTEIHQDGRTFVETFKRGAFARTIRERGAAKVKLLSQHNDRSNPLGRLTVAREDAAGLYIEGRVSQTQAGDEALELVRDGALDAFSIGFTVPPGGAVWSNRDRNVDIVEAALREVSVVSFPAYSNAVIQAVRAAEPYDPRLDPELLRAQLVLAQL